MPLVKLNDIKMYYQIIGEGEPLIIIWGMGGEQPSFVESLKTKINGIQLIIFHNRGTGRTDKPDIPYSIEMMAEDTLSLMNHLNIDKAHILGISLGSRIALTLAAKNPERVESLILNVAASRSPQKNYKNAAVAYERLKEALKNPEMLKAMGKYPPSQKSFLRLFDALERFDGTEMLKNIKAPTIIINGTKDASTPIKCANELKNGIKNSKLILVDDNHFFIRTQPELLIKPMLKFIKDLKK
jgi:pimeloyl-ACP methyl ester carboxylesterase